MYNTKRKEVNLSEYSKSDINISNITLNLVIFVYFYCISLVAAKNDFNLFSIDDFSILSAAVMIGTAAVIKYVYKSCKNINMVSFLIFMFFILNLFFLRNFLIYLCTGINIFYAMYILFLLADYGNKHKKFIDKYENMINFDKYNPKFLFTFIIFLLCFIFLFIINFAGLINKVHLLKFYLMFHDTFLLNLIIETMNDIEKSDVSVYTYCIFFSAGIFGVAYIYYKIFLLDYQYVFILLPLSMHSSIIPLSAVIPVFNEDNFDGDNIDKNALQQWFDNNVSCYIKNVYLDIENKIIVFNKFNLTDDYQQALSEYNNYNDNEDTVYSLDKAVKKINDLMGLVVYKGTNLTNVLYTMKVYLEKIDKLHTNKLSYDKYIDRIDRKYVPYVEHLVKTYLRNIDLHDESFTEIQEKIVYTLDEIAHVMQTIYKSKTELIKFNLDVELDTIELLIRQNGYYKDTI